jgi:hypothetical protein
MKLMYFQMFISQSVVVKTDASMLVRLAHEISHSWFGLVIGALDWTEEWLSEVRGRIFSQFENELVPSWEQGIWEKH